MAGINSKELLGSRRRGSRQAGGAASCTRTGMPTASRATRLDDVFHDDPGAARAAAEDAGGAWIATSRSSSEVAATQSALRQRDTHAARELADSSRGVAARAGPAAARRRGRRDRVGGLAVKTSAAHEGLRKTILKSSGLQGQGSGKGAHQAGKPYGHRPHTPGSGSGKRRPIARSRTLASASTNLPTTLIPTLAKLSRAPAATSRRSPSLSTSARAATCRRVRRSSPAAADAAGSHRF